MTRTHALIFAAIAVLLAWCLWLVATAPQAPPVDTLVPATAPGDVPVIYQEDK